jgi:hypothetical protein
LNRLQFLWSTPTGSHAQERKRAVDRFELLQQTYQWPGNLCFEMELMQYSQGNRRSLIILDNPLFRLMVFDLCAQNTGNRPREHRTQKQCSSAPKGNDLRGWRYIPVRRQPKTRKAWRDVPIAPEICKSQKPNRNTISQ